MNSASLALALPSPVAPLSRLGWGKRILLLVGFLLALQLAVAGIAVFAILKTSGEAKLTEAVANERIVAAVAARQAVLDLDRNQMRLIAADEPEAIRKAAVASIRGGSNLDESFARLAKSFGDHPRVAQLVRLSEALKEPRIAVIAAAKKNDDADAFAKVEALAPKIEAIDSLSAEILAAEQRALAERLSENVRLADALTAILAAVSLGGLALGVAAGVPPRAR